MSSDLQIWLVRHGETAWSLSGQHTGNTDLPLTAHGESQASALGPKLAQMAFSDVLVSPRLRASQTCKFAGLSATSAIEQDLAEWDYGDYEGLRSADIEKMQPGWNIWRDGCPHGETPSEVAERADRLIARLDRLEGRVALFSHGQFGVALAARWMGLPMAAGQHFELYPATLSTLAYAAHHPQTKVLALWNEQPDRANKG